MVQLRYVLMFAAVSVAMLAAERTVDPTFLRRNIAEVKPASVYVATDTCEYRPLFGEGDSVTSIPRGVARFGEITVKPGGSCKEAQFPNQEEIYVVLAGTGTLRAGDQKTSLVKDDFLYIPARLTHTLANEGASPLRVIAAGYKLPANEPVTETAVLKANLEEVKKQTVGGHPDSVLYQLMMGDYLYLYNGLKGVGLYDYKNDIMLTKNIFGQKPEIEEKMEAKVKAIIQQYNNRMIGDKLTVQK